MPKSLISPRWPTGSHFELQSVSTKSSFDIFTWASHVLLDWKPPWLNSWISHYVYISSRTRAVPSSTHLSNLETSDSPLRDALVQANAMTPLHHHHDLHTGFWCPLWPGCHGFSPEEPKGSLKMSINFYCFPLLKSLRSFSSCILYQNKIHPPHEGP